MDAGQHLDPLICPAALESLKALRDYVERAAQAAALSKEATFALKMALDELVTNAVSYGFAGRDRPGELRLWAQLSPQQLSLFLEDDGIAFDPTTHETGFHADMAINERAIGGMGLHMVRQQVDEFRYERVGERNRVQLLMRRPASPPSAQPQTLPLHLLAVDAAPTHRATLYEALENKGCHVDYAADLAAALAALAQSPCEVLLLVIPREADSEAWLKELKGHYPHLPLMLLSSSVDEAFISKCLELADDYFLEPIIPALLLGRLQAWMTRRRSLKAYRSLEEDLQQVILPVSLALAAEGDFDHLLERIVLEAKRVCDADAGTLYLREGDELRFAIVSTTSLGLAMGGTTGKVIEFPPLPLFGPQGEPNLQNVATYATHNGEVVNLTDIYHAENFDFSATRHFDEQNNYRSQSCLTIPLKVYNGEVIGVLQLLNSRDRFGNVGVFDSYEQLIVELLATQATVALSNQLLVQRQSQLLTYERDMQIGRQIQASFLPTTFPELPGWEVASYFRAAREVAGDFYDLFEIPSKRAAVMVADVADKGVGAALFMSLMRSLLRSFSSHNYTVDWGKMLESGRINMRRMRRLTAKRLMPSAGMMTLENAVLRTNNYVATVHRSLNMFATLFYGIIEPNVGQVLYINGGHNAPIWIDAAGGLKGRLEPTGPAIGMMENIDFEIDMVELEVGDLLVLFSDGITDARNAQGESYQEQRLLSLMENPPPSAQAMVSRIVEDLQGYIGEANQYDDITLLVLRRVGEAAS